MTSQMTSGLQVISHSCSTVKMESGKNRIKTPMAKILHVQWNKHSAQDMTILTLLFSLTFTLYPLKRSAFRISLLMSNLRSVIPLRLLRSSEMQSSFTDNLSGTC